MPSPSFKFVYEPIKLVYIQHKPYVILQTICISRGSLSIGKSQFFTGYCLVQFGSTMSRTNIGELQQKWFCFCEWWSFKALATAIIVEKMSYPLVMTDIAIENDHL